VQSKFEKMLILAKIKAMVPFEYCRETSDSRGGAILSYYFDRKVNAGDLIGPYLIGKLAGRKVSNCRSKIPDHLLAVGSVLHEANANSYVWGAGCLSENHVSSKLRAERIFALRGLKSLNAVQQTLDTTLENISLGDPAVLLPEFFNPAVKSKFKIGIIPHYWHFGKVTDALSADEHVKVIDIRCSPEQLVTQIKECEVILSTSLHGLILADSYDIPNKWVEVASVPLLGERFKFQDYYSTTSSPNEVPLELCEVGEFCSVLGKVKQYAQVKNFVGCKVNLRQALYNALSSMN